jgi:hypothetical protein
MTSAALIALEGSKEEEECFFPERDMMRVKLFFCYSNATMNSLSLSGDVCVTKKRLAMDASKVDSERELVFVALQSIAWVVLGRVRQCVNRAVFYYFFMKQTTTSREYF